MIRNGDSVPHGRQTSGLQQRTTSGPFILRAMTAMRVLQSLRFIKPSAFNLSCQFQFLFHDSSPKKLENILHTEQQHLFVVSQNVSLNGFFSNMSTLQLIVPAVVGAATKLKTARAVLTC